MPIRIAIVEDDAPFAGALQDYFAQHSGIQCEAVFSSGEAAVAAVPALPIDVLLVDINLPKINGIQVITQVSEKCPSLVCLVLTMYEEGSLIFDALKAGACGYLLKRTPPEAIVAAIEEAHAGGSPMTPRIARRVVSFFKKDKAEVPPGFEVLTDREREVLDLLSKGKSYKDIADLLNISGHTVNSHIRRMYKKLHISSRSEAVAKYKGLAE